MNKIISVITPAYNCEQFIKNTIESIEKQTIKDQIEIVVVDDCSIDKTSNNIMDMMLAEDNIVFDKNSVNLQMSETRKKGFLLSTGKYVTFLDNDDYYIDDCFFENAISILEKNKTINTYIASNESIDENNDRKYVDLGYDGFITNEEYVNNFYLKYKKPFSSMSLVVRKTSNIIELFKKSYMINDTTIYLSSLIEGDVYLHNHPVAVYRFHDNNTSKKCYKTSFILDQIREKNMLCNTIINKGVIEKKNEWKYNQMIPTIYHFSDTSANFINSIVLIFYTLFCINYKKYHTIKYIMYRHCQRIKKGVQK